LEIVGSARGQEKPANLKAVYAMSRNGWKGLLAGWLAVACAAASARMSKEKTMKKLRSLLILTVLCCAGVVQAADAVVGKWNTVDEKTGEVTSGVELFEQNGELFGKITSLPEPNGKDGKPKVCAECTGADKDQPVVGLVIVKNLRLKGDRYKGGTLLDPNDGKVYEAQVWMADGKLKVRGYIGLFYRTQTWVRAK
jgi:uncharacterized protein (DUF2147 family)